MTAQAPVPPRCGWSWHTDDAQFGHRHACWLAKGHDGRHECGVILLTRRCKAARGR